MCRIRAYVCWAVRCVCARTFIRAGIKLWQSTQNFFFSHVINLCCAIYHRQRAFHKIYTAFAHIQHWHTHTHTHSRVWGGRKEKKKRKWRGSWMNHKFLNFRFFFSCLQSHHHHQRRVRLIFRVTSRTRRSANGSPNNDYDLTAWIMNIWCWILFEFWIDLFTHSRRLSRVELSFAYCKCITCQHIANAITNKPI